MSDQSMPRPSDTEMLDWMLVGMESYPGPKRDRYLTALLAAALEERTGRDAIARAMELAP